MTKTRDSFIFYRSFYEAICDLPEKKQLMVYKSIAEFSLNFQEIPMNGIQGTIFKLIKPQLEANKRKYINGLKGGEHGVKGGRPKNPKVTPKKPLNNPKLTPNVNDNGNVNDNSNNNDNNIPTEFEFVEFAKSKVPNISVVAVRLKYDSWVLNGWKTGGNNPREIDNWKQTLLNTLPFIKLSKDRIIPIG